MDNPEIKSMLKSAKDTIKNKDFKETLKICKVYLRHLHSLSTHIYYLQNTFI